MSFDLPHHRLISHRTVQSFLLFAAAMILAIPLAGADASAPATVSPPRVEVLLDGSRSTAPAAVADRAALIADLLLPPTRTVWRVDRGVAKVPLVAGISFDSRYSDYANAMQQVVVPLAGADPGTIVILIGDGFESAVGPDLAPAICALVSDGADRDQIDQAVLNQAKTSLESAVAAANLHFLILDSAAKPASGGLFPWLIGQRPETARISLPVLDLGTLITELTRLGLDFGKPWNIGGGVQICTGNLTINPPEGSSTVDLYINAVGDDGGFTVAVNGPDGKALPVTPADGSGSGLRLLKRDDVGVGRAYTVLGADSGPALTIVSSMPVQVLAFAQPKLAQRMELAPPWTADALFTGDVIQLIHHWTRVPSGDPVSPELEKTLMEGSTLQFMGTSITPITSATMPAAAGISPLTIVVKEPWASRVTLAPLALSWRVPEPLVLSGGFAVNTQVAGQPVLLELAQSGGRKPLSAVSVMLVGPAGVSRPVVLSSDSDHHGSWRAMIPFSGGDLGSWTLDHVVPTGSESVKIAIATGHSVTVDITRDWLPWIIAGLVILLVMLLLLWWYIATMPRWKGELLERNGAHFLLSAMPGVPRRTTSHGLSDLGHQLQFTLHRNGVVIDGFASGITVYINGLQVAPGVMLNSGNDLEVVSPFGNRVHARFFASETQAKAWDHERAQINAMTDFDQEHVIIEG